MNRSFRKAVVNIAVAICVSTSSVATYATGVSLNETGSTLLYPLFQSWITGYKSIAPTVTLTDAATGSGEGIRSAINGSARIGTSDAYLSDDVAAQNPQVFNIPLAISAQTINYNLPSLQGRHLRLDGSTLAAIYLGNITEWDDPALRALNPGVALPHHVIIPVRRADGSGDTFIFTQFLDFAASSWQDNPGFGTEIAWPKLRVEVAATGNSGVLHTLSATPYTIGYLGISYASDIAKSGLGTAMIRNQNGKFLLPTAQSIADGAAGLDQRTPAYERISLVYAPGDNSYPLINYEYALVSRIQPDAATAQALRAFLRWAISATGGNDQKYLSVVGFIPLPDFVRGLSEAQIEKIRP